MILQLINLEVKKNDQYIVKNINFSLDQGQIFSIVGGSGIGKTTLIRVIAGIEKDYSGQIKKFMLVDSQRGRILHIYLYSVKLIPHVNKNYQQEGLICVVL